MTSVSTLSGSVPHVVIVGGGFGGLYAAQNLGNKNVRVTLIDKRNFHLFQPLLYQVATGTLSPGDIASPLRTALKKFRNVTVLMDEVVGIDANAKSLNLKGHAEPFAYDQLILATGSKTHYFGNDEWGKHSQELKSIESAVDIRRRVLSAFEAAEQEPDPAKQAKLMTIVIVGGGPTGVELAGALAELSRNILAHDFRNIDCRNTKIILVEAAPRILGPYPESLSQWTVEKLTKLGVSVRAGTAVTNIEDECITLKVGEHTEQVYARTVLWAAGVKASELGKTLGDSIGCEIDRGGRVIVGPNLNIPNHPEVYIIGDMASYSHTDNGKPLPGVAPVAMQQGRYVAQTILRATQHPGAALPKFVYQDKGSLAVVSFNEAVASIGKIQLTGFLAWMIWALVHVFYLIEFEHKILVLLQWGWAYLTQSRSARLITGKGSSD